jgi:hypothetical protein
VSSAVRVAKNEDLFRQVNERISELELAADGHNLSEFICECSHTECSNTIQATLEEYGQVRKDPTHFLVIHDHVDLHYERVVTVTDRFTVVEKVGRAGEIAEQEAD